MAYRIGSQRSDFSVLKRFLICSGSSLLLKSISFIVLPILLYKLTPEEYGLYTLSMNFIGIANILCGFGLRQVIGADYFQVSQAKRRELIHAGLFLYLCIATLFLIVALHQLEAINTYLFKAAHTYSDYMVMLSVVFFSFFSELLYLLLQCTQRIYALSLIQISAAVLIAAGMIGGACSSYKVMGLLCGQLAGTVLPAVIGFSWYCKNGWFNSVNLKESITSFGYLVGRGLPFIYSLLCVWFLALGDRWMLAYLTDLQKVSIYAVADSASQLFYFLILAPWTATYQPYMMKQYAEQSEGFSGLAQIEQTHKRRMVVCCCLLALLVTVGFFIGRPVARCLFPEAYHRSISCMLPLLYGQIFLLAGYFSSCLTQFSKRGWLLAMAFVTATATNVALNYVLIPIYGVNGCAWATLIAYGLFFLCSELVSWVCLHKQTLR